MAKKKSFRSRISNRRYLVLFVLAFAIIGGFFIYRSFAATQAYPSSVTAPSITFSVSPNPTVSGRQATFNWSATGASVCDASGATDWMGSLSRSSRKSVNIPSQPTRYQLTCELRRSGGGDLSASEIAFTAPGKVTATTPSLNFRVSPASVKKGQSVTVSWTTTGNIKFCFVDSVDTKGANYIIKKNLPATGSIVQKLNSSRHFRVECSDTNPSKAKLLPTSLVMGMIGASVK